MSERPLLLIVEDDAALGARLARAFEDRGFEVRVEATADGVDRAIADDTAEFVVLDLRIGSVNGLDLIPRFKEADPATRIVVLTGYGSIATAIEAVRRGATHYLTKPADADEILAAFDAGGDTERETPPPPPDVARSRAVGAHQPRARRVRRQRLGGRSCARHPSPVAPAQAGQVSQRALNVGPGVLFRRSDVPGPPGSVFLDRPDMEARFAAVVVDDSVLARRFEQADAIVGAAGATAWGLGHVR